MISVVPDWGWSLWIIGSFASVIAGFVWWLVKR